MQRSAAHAPPAAVAAALGVGVGVSLLLRTGALDAGYWIDEAISIGIASYDLADIPGALRQDGSPPLYYLLLHAWMAVAGTGEAATRALSLVFALAAVPVAWWAGCALFDRRTGAVAAAWAAGCPFLTYYAQETRMYTLVALLSLLACASFVLAFQRGRRRHLAWLVLWTALLLYTHTWGMFLAAGMAVAWLRLWRAGRVAGADGARVGAAVALLYAPWLPTLLFQAANTGAPWAQRPSPLFLLAVLGAAAAAGAARLAGPGAESARVLLTVTAVAAAAAWAFSQLQPAWAPRYLAVVVGPLLLVVAALVARGPRWAALALVGAGALWLLSGPPGPKSNARAVAAAAAPAVRPGDLVVSTQPEQVPVLYRYLPRGLVYLTPLGAPADPGVVDWRRGVTRLRAGRAERRLLPALDGLATGRRVLLVTPLPAGRRSRAPWTRAVRARTREWRRVLRSDRRLRSLGAAPLPAGHRPRNGVRAELFEVRRSGTVGTR